MKIFRRMSAVLLSLIMVLSMMPAMAFAEDDIATSVPLASDEETAVEEADAVDEADVDVSDDDADIADDEDFGVAEGFSDAFIDDADLEDFDVTPEEQAEGILIHEDGSAESGFSPSPSKSIKGGRLTGRDLKYYNAFRSIIKKVSAGKTTSSKKKMSVRSILGRRTITARQLGVKRIGYKKNGVWHISSKAQKALYKRLGPKNWGKVYTSVLSDMSNDSFWVDWYTRHGLIYYPGFNYTTNKITFKSSARIICRLPVQPEFQGSTWKVNKSSIKAVSTAKENARYLVDTFDNAAATTFAGYPDEQIDTLRLWNYCRWIAIRNTYDKYAAEADYDYLSYKGPWSWVYVFDGNDSTNAVCEGYARALKLLCDMSRFKSRWIDCQIVSGSAGTGADSKHMWNIVRMNDGLNYVIDPTWMDRENPDDGYDVNERWFLRGAPDGTAAGYTIEGNTRIYEDWVKKVFAPAERRLSKNDYYLNTTDREIKLKGTKLKLSRGKRSFKAKWTKVSTPLGALYIDGYQIRYSTRKSMKGSKYVKVKGYARKSKTISKLRSRKRYYVQIRTYAKVGGKTYYSNWSTRKKVKTR